MLLGAEHCLSATFESKLTYHSLRSNIVLSRLAQMLFFYSLLKLVHLIGLRAEN